MSAIINIGNIQPTPPAAYSGSSPPPSVPVSALSNGADTVEISAFGQALAQATELSSLSVARIRAFRASIADGTFETPERINGTVNRLMERVL